jgi:hypothetical protein
VTRLFRLIVLSLLGLAAMAQPALAAETAKWEKVVISSGAKVDWARH